MDNVQVVPKDYVRYAALHEDIAEGPNRPPILPVEVSGGAHGIILQFSPLNKLGDVAASAHNHENDGGRPRRAVQNQKVPHRPKQYGAVSRQILSFVPDAWIPRDRSKCGNKFSAHLAGDPVTGFTLIIPANGTHVRLG